MAPSNSQGDSDTAPDASTTSPGHHPPAREGAEPTATHQPQQPGQTQQPTQTAQPRRPTQAGQPAQAGETQRQQSRQPTQAQQPVHGQNRPQHTARRQTNKPAGITAIAVALGLLGSTSVLGGLVLGNAGATATSYGATGAGTALGGVGIVFAVLGACELLTVYGLWTRRRWGWQLGVGVLGLGALGSLVLVSGSPPMGLAGLALHGGMAWYLVSQRGYYRQTHPVAGR